MLDCDLLNTITNFKMNKFYFALSFVLCFPITSVTVAQSVDDIVAQAVAEADQASTATVFQTNEHVTNDQLSPEELKTIIELKFSPEKQYVEHSEFNAEKIQSIEVKDLNPETLIKALYPYEIIKNQNINNQEVLRNRPFFTISAEIHQWCGCTAQKTTSIEKFVIVPQKVIEFENITHEARYLVPIEHWNVENEMSDGALYSPTLELFLFQKTPQGTYQLITRTPEHYQALELTGDFHAFELIDQSYVDLKNNMGLIGQQRLGSFIENRSKYMGENFSQWNMISLKENEWIRAYYVGDASRDNVSFVSDADRAYKFSSELSLSREQNKDYFPVKIKYTGKVYDLAYEKLMDMNDQYVFEYEPNYKVYVYDQATLKKLLLKDQENLKILENKNQ